MVHPKKYLGQHFLTDPGIAARIAGSLKSDSDTAVLEIGPGKGILTEHLLERGLRRLVPVEIDPEAAAFLRQRWPGLENELLEKDFLRLDLARLEEEKMAVIGNFPYNISSQIFFHILEYKNTVVEIVCMLQKEVAERLVSPPGSKQYGILSVLLQAYYTAEYLFRVKPGSFFPPPKVQSGVIRLSRNTRQSLPCDESLFKKIVKTTFQQRRKTIRNSLRTILLNLNGDNELLSKRPEQLSVEEFVALTNWVERQR